jgi:hypothetical protein
MQQFRQAGQEVRVLQSRRRWFRRIDAGVHQPVLYELPVSQGANVVPAVVERVSCEVAIATS